MKLCADVRQRKQNREDNRSSERRDVLVVGVFDNHDEKGFWGSALEKRIKMNSKMPTIAKNTMHAVREE